MPYQRPVLRLLFLRRPGRRPESELARKAGIHSRRKEGTSDDIFAFAFDFTRTLWGDCLSCQCRDVPAVQKIKPPADGHRVIFRSGQNRLTGYLWNETRTRGLLVFAHGMGAGVEYYLPEIHHFAAQGYKVFAFEYSGYPGSSGHFYGFPQAVIDLKNALDFIDDGSLPVVLMGHSMGAYAV